MRSQIHGKVFEDMIKACEFFTSSADSSRSPNSIFDIESKFNKKDGLPVSVKTTKSNTIGLADARRFVSINEPFKIIVGLYHQTGSIKEFYEIKEFILTQDVYANLLGTLNLDFVTYYHKIISLKSLNNYRSARAVAQAINSVSLDTSLSLNPKIDSKNQRRLQASVSLSNLETICQTFSYQDSYSNLVLPLKIISPPRN